MENVLKDSMNINPDVKNNEFELSSVVENLSELIWSVDLTTEPYRLVYHNKPKVGTAFTGEVFRFPSTLDVLQDRIHPEDKDRVLEEIVNALSSGTASYSYRLQGEDRKYRYFRDRITVLYDEEKPIRLDVITIDIDHIRRSRLSLELSQQRLRSIVDALPDPVFISVKNTGKVIFANEVLFEIYEMAPEDFLGKKVIQFYDNFEGRRTYLEKLSIEGSVQNHELLLKNKNGESFWVSASTTPLEFQGKDCYITILQDVTIRKNLERDIKESNERYQLAVEGTNDAIFEYDYQTKFSYMSPQFWDGMGLKREANPLDDNLITRYLSKEDTKGFLLALEQTYENNLPELTLEIRLESAQEEQIWALFKCRVIYELGKPSRVVGSLSNITSLKRAQSKLKESEAKYKLISENSSDCICLQSIDGTFLFVSPSSYEVLGYSPDELQNLRMRQFIHENDLHKVSEAMLKVIRGEVKSGSIVFRALHKNGNYEWLETVGGTILGEDGKPQFLLTSTRSVTERVEAQERLRESEEKYKLITENSQDIVTLMDLEGRYVFVSPSIKDTMGYQPDELMGQLTTDYVHPDDLTHIVKELSSTIEDKTKDNTVVFRFKHKNGEWRWIQATGGVILNEEGEPIYMRSNKIDITDKRLTEEKLKKKEEQYKLVSENSGDVIALHGLDGRYTFVSPSCYHLMGMNEEESMKIHPFALIHKEDREAFENAFDHTIKQKRKDAKTSYRLKTKWDEYVWVGVSLSAVLGEDDEVLYVMSSTRDISEIIKVIEKERQLNKLKSSFISMASHEFRTPLTTIQSSNELISMYLAQQSEAEKNDKLEKHVGRIRTELDRLNSLLKDVFTLGRIDVGKIGLKKEMISLKAILKQVILEVTVSFKGRKVDIQIEGQERQLLIDSQLMSHVLSNLINNALKYSEGKKDPIVTLNFDENQVEILVTDFGIGIPEKDREGLFESFSRASNVADIEGTGLGLVIVRQFVEMHGGDISFETSMKNGSTFKVVLPGT